MKIVLEGMFYSKKNSPKIIKIGGRYSVSPNDNYRKWEKRQLYVLSLKKFARWDGDYPLVMFYKLYPETLRLFDHNNIIQGAQDVLVKAGIIAEDNYQHLIPAPVGVELDRLNPRIEIVLAEYKAIGDNIDRYNLLFFNDK